MAVVTVRDHIRSMQVEIRDTDLQPDRAAELLTKITALIGNVNDQIREADMAYHVVLLGYLDSDEAANRARIRAQTTPEYLRAREAKDTKELCLEMARSLKYFLKAKYDEFQMSKHQ